MYFVQKLLPANLSRLILKAYAFAATTAAICRQPARCLRPASAVLIVLSLSFASAATAQTAHFVTAEQVAHATNGGALFDGNSIGMAVDAAGNIYVVDSPNHVLTMATPSTNGYELTSIAFGLSANGVAVDQQGNVYIADTGNQRVLKETLSGGTYTESSISSSTPLAIAVDATGKVFAILGDGATVIKLTPSGSTYIQSTVVAGLDGANSIAVDSNDNLYITASDLNLYESLVLKETASSSGYIQSTIDNALNLPFGIAVDKSGNVYVAATYPSMVVKEVPTGSSYTETPVPTVSTLQTPVAIAFDSSGNFYIEDDASVGDGIIYKEMPGIGNFGSVSVGSSNQEIGVLFQFDTGGVLGSVESVTEGANNLDFINSTQGSPTCVPATTFTAGQQCAATVNFAPTVAGSRNGAVTLKTNSGITFASAYLSGTGVGPQVNFLVGGVPDTQKTIPYSTSGQSSPYAVAVDAAGNVYIADSNNNRVLKETLSGGAFTESQIGSGLNSPAQIAVDGLGNVYIADTGNGRVVKEILNNGTYTQSEIDNGFSSPNGVAVDAAGNVYVADTLNDRVWKLTPSGNSYYLGLLPTSGLSTVFGLAVDNAGNVYIADTGNSRVVMETPSGSTYTQSVVASSLNEPFSVAVDGFGNVFIAQFNNPTIRRESPLAGGGFSIQEPATGTLNAPYGIAVDGLGNVYIADVGSNQVYKEDYADAPSITFDTTNVGQTSADSPNEMVLENIGNLPLQFSIPGTGSNPSVSPNFSIDSTVYNACPVTAAGASNVPSLNSGAWCTLAVDFSPTAAGTFSGSVTITDNAFNAPAPAYTTQTFGVSGIGIGPQAYLSATSEAFGSQLVGTASASRYITLTNTGSVALTISSIAVTGANASSFDFANTCGTTLAPGANCSIHGHFAPVAGGELFADVTVTDNSANSPQTIALTGTGVEPPVTLSATSLTFPSTTVDASSGSQSVTLTNTGTATLSITSIALTGTNASSFVFANDCGSILSVGANCAIHGHFTPTKSGALTASITITDNASNSPQSIALSGTGVETPVGLSATSLSFGSVDLGAMSGSQSVTMTNNGTAALTITSISLSGTNASSFVFANSCGTTLAAGANCTIHGHFAPTATGAMTATINITDSASTSPQSIALSGTGLSAAPVTLSSTSLSFPATTVGSASSSQSVTLTNNGTATLTFTSIALTGANASSFVFANSCGTSLAVGAGCTIHGHFAPTTTGALTAAITITDSAAGSPQTITLTGTGQ